MWGCARAGVFARVGGAGAVLCVSECVLVCVCVCVCVCARARACVRVQAQVLLTKKLLTKKKIHEF